MFKFNFVVPLILVTLCVLIAAAPATDDSMVKIVKYENKPLDKNNKYSFNYQLSDGQTRSEEGELVPTYNDESKSALSVSGSYEYIGPDGMTYRVSYLADENGFQPIGDHIPGSVKPLGLPPNAIASLIG